MDCPHKISPLGTPVTHHKPPRSYHARSDSRHHHEDRGRQGNPDHSLVFENMAAQAITICIEANLDHNTKIDEAITGTAHGNCAPPIEVTAIDLATIHYINLITDHPHIEVLQPFNPEITVGHIHDHPTDLQGRTHIDQVHTPADHEENCTIQRTQR